MFLFFFFFFLHHGIFCHTWLMKEYIITYNWLQLKKSIESRSRLLEKYEKNSEKSSSKSLVWYTIGSRVEYLSKIKFNIERKLLKLFLTAFIIAYSFFFGILRQILDVLNNFCVSYIYIYSVHFCNLTFPIYHPEIQNSFSIMKRNLS